MSDQLEAPVSAAPEGRRIGEVDSLRGFALFGILVTNALMATALFSFNGTGTHVHPTFDGTQDHFVAAVLEALFLGKFYLLFAFLFGYSFTLQIAAARRADAPAVPRLVRRGVMLFAIGLAHVLFLWIGDIFTLYGGLCLILVLLRNIRPRTALITGLILYFTFALLAFLPGAGGMTGLGDLFDFQAMHRAYTGSFVDTLHIQQQIGPKFMLLTWFAQGIPALSMFLIGMAAGKYRVFEDRERLQRWVPRALTVGFGVGVPISLISYAYLMVRKDMPAHWYGLQELANPFMTLGYIGGIIWLTRTRWAAAVARLAPAGRMAASNYIGQSVVLMVVYTGYGLALADKVPPAGVFAIAVVTFAAQLGFSAWWLRRHAYGPVEWLLRAATYLTVPAWRKSSV
ncbi:DUF418 domain-containing protein [Nocardia sp. NPDC088792]|uniref:DUF418 domain-containing protein n=1 Tax=Nocardia sp. NPDC088792 TaxID=3364332 RepID=UPI0037FD0FD3